MLKVALCDDDYIFTKYLSNIISTYGKRKFEISSFNDPRELLDQMNQKKHFDLIFLDIEMPNINGMELANEITKISKEPFFIFISGFDRALEAFRINALDYIVKPVKEESVYESLDRFILEFDKIKTLKENAMFFIYENKNQYFKVNYNNILYFEKVVNKIILHYLENESIHTIAFYLSLNDIEKQLDFNYFFRCHKSYIVNKKYINHLKNKKIIIKPYNIVIDVSRAKLEEVKNIIKNKLFKG
ncbi:MAG: LytR/AlgR family response regulator transcription factor [Eubacteriales bacterium]